MKCYQITYTVLGSSETISPLYATVYGFNEYDAKCNFLSTKNFYNTNDPNKVHIDSIRRIKNQKEC